MSRSYKKNPIYKDHHRGGKKAANRKVRKTKNIPDGVGYKKVYCQYDVVEYRFYESKQEAINWWEKNKHTTKHYDSVEDVINFWRRYHYSK